MEQIAARAEVGIGTLYRRFPNKADLCAAVVDAATDRTCQIADEVLLEVAPGDAVFEFIRRCVDAPSSWRAATSRRPWSGGGADRALADLMPLHRSDPRGQPRGGNGPARYRPHRRRGDPDVSPGHRRPLRRRRPGHFPAVPRIRPRRPAARTQDTGAAPDVGQTARTRAHRPLRRTPGPGVGGSSHRISGPIRLTSRHRLRGARALGGAVRTPKHLDVDPNLSGHR